MFWDRACRIEGRAQEATRGGLMVVRAVDLGNTSFGWTRAWLWPSWGLGDLPCLAGAATFAATLHEHTQWLCCVEAAGEEYTRWKHHLCCHRTRHCHGSHRRPVAAFSFHYRHHEPRLHPGDSRLRHSGLWSPRWWRWLQPCSTMDAGSVAGGRATAAWPR